MTDLVDVDDATGGIPPVWVGDQGQVLLDVVGAVLVEHSQLRAAARAASHPQDHRCVRAGRVSVLEEEVKPEEYSNLFQGLVVLRGNAELLDWSLQAIQQNYTMRGD